MLTKDPRVKQPCLHRNLPTIDNRFNCVFSSCLVPRECRIPQAVCKAHFKPILAAGMCPNDFQITLATEDAPKSKLNECVLVAVPHAVAKEGQGGVDFWNPHKSTHLWEDERMNDYNKLGDRVSACEQYLSSLVSAELNVYGKGEWLTVVRNRGLWTIEGRG